MTIICLNNMININFNLYKKVIINVKMFKKFDIIKKFDRIFKRKLKRYHFFENKIYIYQRYIIFSYINYVFKRNLWFNKKTSSVKVTMKHDFK